MADMVSERYALSLYEVAQDEKQEKLYLDQLTEVCAAFDSEPDFLKMLTTPSIAAEDKQKVLISSGGSSAVVHPRSGR